METRPEQHGFQSVHVTRISLQETGSTKHKENQSLPHERSLCC